MGASGATSLGSDDPQAAKNKSAQQINDRLILILPPKIRFGDSFHNERSTFPNGMSEGPLWRGVKF
jgi:hypothetical protein